MITVWDLTKIVCDFPVVTCSDKSVEEWIVHSVIRVMTKLNKLI